MKTSALRRVQATGLAAAVLLTLGLGSAVASADPAAPPTDGVYGDPVAAAYYWQAQSLEDNCGAMSVADVVGELTGDEPTEAQILIVAEKIPSPMNPGIMIYTPDTGGISQGDLPALLDHYGIKAVENDSAGPGLDQLEKYLGEGRKIIAHVNSATLWNVDGQRTDSDHAVVVTGIDTNKNIVHLNDPGIDSANEKIPSATFLKAWGAGGYAAVVTAAA
jgi:hypothetical protein